MDVLAVPGRRFLALGDSYTIGEAVGETDRWPAQLARLLGREGLALASTEIIASTGWTTGELAQGIRLAGPRGPFDLVSLLIGVNNQYRGRPIDEYRAELRELLVTAVDLAGGAARNVVVLSIPDWGVTPFAEGRERAGIARGIDSFNEVNRGEAARVDARYVDVTQASRRAFSEPELIAGDGLHPSAAMYARWAELVLPEARAAMTTG